LNYLSLTFRKHEFDLSQKIAPLPAAVVRRRIQRRLLHRA